MFDLMPKLTAAAAVCLMAACSPSTPAPSGDEAPTPEAGAEAAPESGGTLRIYSARHYDSDRFMYEAFEEQSGVRVLYREAGANQLLETMKAEGANSPADLIIASDAGALWRFEDAGLTQALPEGEFESRIPERLLDDGRQWVGLARRVRGVAYDPERINPDQVDEWMDLADPARRLSALDYRRAEQRREALGRRMQLFHQDYDLLITPQLPITAFAAGHEVPPGSGMTRWWEWSPFTYPFNLTQQPAATVPCGFAADGLPVAMQIVAAKFREDLVLRASGAYEQAYPFVMPPADRTVA